MPVTYKKIASVTVTGATAANMEFTSIPNTYDDLLIKVSGRSSDTNNAVYIISEFNGVTTNYSARDLYGTGSAAASRSVANSQAPLVPAAGSTATTFGNTEFYIPNYASSNNKSYSADSVTENNATLAYTALVALLWSNTSAITSIKLSPGLGSFVQYSTAVLYGIKKN